MVRIAPLILVAALAGPAAAEGKHNCHCIFDGGEVEEGKTACIKTANGYSLARCEMVLNNTSWKFLGTPCEKLESVRSPIAPKRG